MDAASNIYIWSWNGNNYFEFLSGMVLYEGSSGIITGNLNLTTQQAYAIDSKMDDGFPTSGKVTAAYAVADQVEYPGYSYNLNLPVYWPTTAGTATSCYDNGGAAVGAAPYVYSTEMNSKTK